MALARRQPIISIFLLVLCFEAGQAQRELVPEGNPVYRFLLRQQLRGSLNGFQWGMLPLSRHEISALLDSLVTRRQSLPRVDRAILNDLETEFHYDRTLSTEKVAGLLPGVDLSSLFDDQRQKFLYAYGDSTTSVFIDGFGMYSYRAARGDSIGSGYASLGELGFRVRGTLFGHLGYYIQASNGALLSGSHELALLDPRLRTSKKFNGDEKRYFDFTTGYLRYDTDWLALTLGREQILWGTGYNDRVVFSDNTAPFDYARIDLRAGPVHYAFLHGSIVGADTNGRTLSSKYIASHRLELGLGSRLRVDLNEVIIYSREPVNFAFLNPMVFLTSADLSTELSGSGDDNRNTIIVLDGEFTPVRNLRLSGSWVIDDLNISTLGKSDISGNTNKFGWQAGVLWNDAFTVPGLLVDVEYTRLNPFLYSHRTIVNSYSHWNLPLGPALHPNSDEWLLRVDYEFTNRLSATASAKFQRSGENTLDGQGLVAYNAGADILRGDGDMAHPNVFLEGRRVNTIEGYVGLTWQPIRQYFVDVKYFYRSLNYLSESRKLVDSNLWVTVRVDY